VKPTQEQWRAVPGYEGLYEVSDQGRVKSVEREVPHGYLGSKRVAQRIMKAPLNNRGYYMVRLCRRAKYENFTVHRLVMLAFVGERPNGLAVRHLNGNSRDNRLTNLAYGTYAENNQDIVDHGRNHNANKTHCKRGHKFTTDNTLLHPSGVGRTCRKCLRMQQKDHTEKKQAKSRQAARRPNTPGENWLPVVGFEGEYSVSDQGRVRSESRYVRCLSGSPTNLVESRRLLRQRILKVTMSSGYPKVALGRGSDGRDRGRRIHVLVAEAFIGPRPDGMYVRHLNDNPCDNWLENLAYGTPEQNQLDRYRNRLTA
jgi:hypothetical protein